MVAIKTQKYIMAHSWENYVVFIILFIEDTIISVLYTIHFT